MSMILALGCAGSSGSRSWLFHQIWAGLPHGLSTLLPQSCRFLFFTSAHSPRCGLNAFQVLIKVQVSSIPALHRLPAFCHQCPRTALIFVVTIDVLSKSAAQTLLRLKTFVLCSFHVFPHFFHEARCLIFFFFFLSFLFVCSCFLKRFVQVGFSRCTFPAALGPRDFLFFHERIERFTFCRDFYPLFSRFRLLLGVHGALSPAAPLGLLPPGFRGDIPLSAFPPITFLCHGPFSEPQLFS